MPGTFTLTEEQATLLLSLEDWPSFHEGGFELPLILEIEKFRPQWLTFGDRGFDLFGVCRVWQVLPTRLGLIAAKCALRRIAGETLSASQIEARSQCFKEVTGHSPEDFVRLYRDGEIPSTLNNTLSFWDALFLAGHEVA